MSDQNHDIIASQWVFAISQGDRRALTEFYDFVSPLLYGLALKILRNSAEAEDVLHDTFLHIWQKAATYQASRSSPSCWAAMILRSKAIDLVRSRKRRANLLERASSERHRSVAALTYPVDAAVAFDEHQHLQSAIDALPDNQQQAIRLAFFEGLTHEEVAEKLKIPVGTIKSRIRRGILELREVVARSDYFGANLIVERTPSGRADFLSERTEAYVDLLAFRD